MIYMLAVLLSLIMVMLSFFISFKNNLDKEMIMSFECGFDPFSMVRSSFSLHFFKICLVFVFFDIEIIIVLLLPLLMIKSLDLMLYFFIMLFIILMGLLFEWSQGSIDWFY
uniref:NADH-ubiquinone oxidoreductase chain 3 n=1 Tax=Laelaps sp. TaxID=3081785 RepID=A0AAU6QDZ0_9ACAR